MGYSGGACWFCGLPEADLLALEGTDSRLATSFDFHMNASCYAESPGAEDFEFRRPKAERQAWWAGLTPERQAAYIERKQARRKATS